jgi:transcriptional regulator
MYIPSSFKEIRLEVLHDLIAAQPLGMLITGGPRGLLASPLPFLLYRKEGECGILRAHLARANAHWKELAEEGECLVVFQGEQGYVTPSWYPSKAATGQAVPTWNYATVHVWGKAKVIEDAAWLRRQLDDITRFHEQGRVPAWTISDAPSAYIDTQMKAVIGIEIPVMRIEGKWKMSQNKDEADRMGVINGMRSEGDPHQNVPLADLVTLGLKKSAAL